MLIAFFIGPSVRADIDLPEPNRADPIAINADAANHWNSGDYDVWLLRGNCVLRQGNYQARSREAVVWIERADGRQKTESKVIAYLEGDAVIEGANKPGTARIADQTWLGRFFTTGEIQISVPQTVGEPAVMPGIYQRGMERRRPANSDALTRSEVLPAQFSQPAGSMPVGPIPGNSPSGIGTPPGVVPGPAALRRIRIFARSDERPNVEMMSDPNDPINRGVVIINSGVNVLIDFTNTEIAGLGVVDSIDLSTDRQIIWTVMPDKLKIGDRDGAVQNQQTPLEIYMEGNIVFRQGNRVIYADKMYYDVTNNVGTILNAEMLTPAPQYEGLLRFKTDLLQQTGPGQYFAHNSFVTSSRMGGPGYRLESGDIYFEDIQKTPLDPLTGQPLADPLTGQPAVVHEKQARASNNFLYLGPVPVFYYPYFASNLEEPTYYIRRARAKYDNIYGTQILTNWNGYELLGIKNKPKDTDLDVSLDYLGKRGWGEGAAFTYGGDSFLGIPGRTNDYIDFWGIPDNGNDNLGVDRPNLKPEKYYRFRMFGQHRQVMPDGYQLSAELGWISDRNFLQSYYEPEWDTLKDQTTDVELRRIEDNREWSLFAGARLNNFFTQTEWLPRGDHYWLGQPLLSDTLTWYEHTSVGYARFKPANTPDNANDQPFAYLPWENSASNPPLQAPGLYGQRLSTRQEIDYPFQLGVVKVVPYALGEATNWGQNIEGSDLTRLYGQAGVRANLPIWSVDADIKDDLFNINGIAHKVNFTAEYAYSQSNKDVSLLPLYDPLDDDSIEAGRRRNLVYDFGGILPPQYDERLYGIRSGLGGSVTSPSTEVAGNLSVFRLGAEQRWQTKRGALGNEHIIDWVTFDTGINLYTNPDRDNFGTVPGMANYDFRWHVGDRLTMVSGGIFDFFSGGQSVFSVGGFLTRPPRGSLYLGYNFIDGPIQNRVVSVSYSYWMTPKWITTLGASIDLGNQGNIGETFGITRVGESLLINLGFSADPTRNSTGVMLVIEPRFLPKSRLNSVNGVHIPPAGANGLE